MFQAPAASGDKLPADEIVGQLLIIRPLEYVENVKTVHGDKDAIRCDVAVLTQQNLDGSWGIVYRDVLWFGGKLVGALKKQINQLVLARMAIGTGKPGQKPPYELDSALEDAQATTFAAQWMGQHPDFQRTFTSPTPPAAAPAPAPIASAAPAPAAVPAPVPAATPAPVPAAPAAIPQAAPMPAAAPAAAGPTTAVPAQPDPAVLAALPPEAQQQLLAAYQQQTPAA